MLVAEITKPNVNKIELITNSSEQSKSETVINKLDESIFP